MMLHLCENAVRAAACTNRKLKHAVKRARRRRAWVRQGSLACPKTIPLQTRSRTILKTLYLIRAPLVLLQLVASIAANPVFASFVENPTQDFAEYYSGKMAITKRFWADGSFASPFDISYDSTYMNMVGDDGFVYALVMALNCIDGGASVMAIVCSSYVFVNRATSGRSRHNPLGNTHLEYVASANVMGSRTVLLMFLFAAIGAFSILEQPKGSLYEEHPRMQFLISTLDIYRLGVPMGWFNAPTRKDSWLYSTKPDVRRILDYALIYPRDGTERKLVRTYVGPDGRQRVDGAPDLKGSQAYTPEFGNAVQCVIASCDAQTKADALSLHMRANVEVPDSYMFSLSGAYDTWPDARLLNVFRIITGSKGS
jgi:hypothetical protein